MQLTLLSKRRIFVVAMAAGLATAAAMFIVNDSSKADPPTPGTNVVLISGDGMGIQQRTAIQYAAYGLDERQPMDDMPYAGFSTRSPRRTPSPTRPPEPPPGRSG